MSVNIAVINIMDGSPDPYNFNDAMSLVNDASHPHIPISFDWVNYTEADRPSHYVVHDGSMDRRLGMDAHGLVPIIHKAFEITTAIQGDNFKGQHLVYKYNISVVDTDVEPGEVMFTLESHPDIWINAIWRD
jgi:hypothetical protein